MWEQCWFSLFLLLILAAPDIEQTHYHPAISSSFPSPQYVIKASSAGVVEKILYTPGQSVAKNAALVKLQETETEGED